MAKKKKAKTDTRNDLTMQILHKIADSLEDLQHSVNALSMGVREINRAEAGIKEIQDCILGLSSLID